MNQKIYRELITTTREIALLNSANSVLGWDEQTQMPPKGRAHRANQMSLIARIVHERFTSPQIGEWLAALGDVKGDSDETVNIREIRRDYERKIKLPASLVEEQSKTRVLAHEAWVEARKKSEYKIFQPWLEKTLDLKKQEADCIGFTTTPYDPLLDEFEPHETTENLRKVFDELRGPLIDLVGRISSSSRKAPVEILQRSYPAAAQEKFAREAAVAIGFDFAAGRLDTSVHPFCTTIGPGDVRLTTRYDESYVGDAFFSVLHEAGHGLYNQGLPAEHYGTPRGKPVSYGIHESQSRLWENFVARSKSFWRHFYPKAQHEFPALRETNLDDFHFAINDVRPSLIRTDADEATYNLHILLRFELEQALLSRGLQPTDLPGAWNEKMKQYFGLEVPDDAHGCLQDIHWSGGSFGYFPSYTLGNLYAAQFFEQARRDLGDLDTMFSRGEFTPLRDWLREKIHQHGKRYPAREMVQRVTGEPLSAKPLLDHLNRKARELYNA